MCKPRAEGGDRCAGHVRPLREAARARLADVCAEQSSHLLYDDPAGTGDQALALAAERFAAQAALARLDDEWNRTPAAKAERRAARAGGARVLPVPRGVRYAFRGQDITGQVSFVPISLLVAHRENDRLADEQDPDDFVVRRQMRWLRESLQGGQEAIREPLELAWDPETGRARLTEGNHRLAVAAESGMTHVPVVGYVSRDRVSPYDGSPRASAAAGGAPAGAVPGHPGAEGAWANPRLFMGQPAGDAETR